MMRKDIIQEWQDLREEGVLIREIAARFHVSNTRDAAHTIPPETRRKLKMRNELICDLYEQGASIQQIAGVVNVDSDLVRITIKTMLGKNAAPKKAYNKVEKPEVDAIPQTLKRRDDCPHRVTRGLTAEEFERLLEVNKEYDERIQRANSDSHGNAGYIRNVDDD